MTSYIQIKRDPPVLQLSEASNHCSLPPDVRRGDDHHRPGEHEHSEGGLPDEHGLPRTHDLTRSHRPNAAEHHIQVSAETTHKLSGFKSWILSLDFSDYELIKGASLEIWLSFGEARNQVHFHCCGVHSNEASENLNYRAKQSGPKDESVEMIVHILPIFSPPFEECFRDNGFRRAWQSILFPSFPFCWLVVDLELKLVSSDDCIWDWAELVVLSDRYLLRMFPPDSKQSEALVEFIRYFRWDTMALLTDNTDYGA